MYDLPPCGAFELLCTGGALYCCPHWGTTVCGSLSTPQRVGCGHGQASQTVIIAERRLWSVRSEAGSFLIRKTTSDKGV